MLIINKHFNFCCFSALAYTTLDRLCAVFTRHSLVRAKDEVFVLLYVFLFVFLFGQRFLENPRADSRESLHAGVLWFRMCLRSFCGLAAPADGKRGK